jgi:hypothetical protein
MCAMKREPKLKGSKESSKLKPFVNTKNKIAHPIDESRLERH